MLLLHSPWSLHVQDLMKQLLRQRDMYKLMASQPSAASATGNLVLTNGSPALANGHAAVRISA